MTTTLAQQRAAYALERLQSLKLNPEELKFLATLLKSLPATMLLNGFGQTLAFLLAKGKEDGAETKHSRAFWLIVGWLQKRRIITQKNEGDILHELAAMPQPSYLQAQEEALDVLEWAKRFAAAGLGARR